MMAQKNIWDIVQIIFTILTPLVLFVGGIIINSTQQEISNNISKLEQTVSSVEAMRPYFDMLAGEDPAQAKMAAYALYMLNKEDPEMAVSLILAASREELNDVLKDIGNRDPNVLAFVSNAVISKEGETAENSTKSQIETSAKSIIQSISTESSGWSFLGTFDGKKWSKSTIKIGNELPEEGKVYEIIDDVYLRDDKPKFPLYKLGKILGVLKEREKIRIDKLEADVGQNRVWAKVTVASR
jgi:hypothetical protein